MVQLYQNTLQLEMNVIIDNIYSIEMNDFCLILKIG